MITDVDDYFTKGCDRCARFDTPDCSTRIWQAGLAELRAICRGMGLTETVKWGHPCYMHADRNVALIGALRGDFRLSFMNPTLLRDPEGVLERAGPNSATPSVMRFASVEDLAAKTPAIRGFLADLMDHAEKGTVPPKAVRELDVPDELVEALDADPELAEAFDALTPGRQRSYVINLNGAKKPETRFARIAKFRDHILAGKGALER